MTSDQRLNVAWPRRPRPARLPEVVADRIQEALLARKFEPGTRLSTEPELAEEHDVSRQVIREAARLLEQRGLVEIRPGRGMVVKRLDGVPIADQYYLLLQMNSAAFEQLMEMRLLVEVGITQMAASNRTAEDLEKLRGVLDLAADALAANDFDACLAADLDFHDLIARATGNPFLRTFMRPVNLCLRQSYRDPDAYLASQPATLAEHKRILQAVVERKPRLAERAAREHLQRVQDQGPDLVPATDGE